MLDIEVTSMEASSLLESDTLKKQWQTLEQCAESTPFISWTWIGPWLEHAAQHFINTRLITINDNKQLVALGLLHEGCITRRKFFRRTLLFLNELPVAGHNMVIEYNGLLVKKGYEQEAWLVFVKKLIEIPEWDELHLNALPEKFCEHAQQALEQHKLLFKYNQDAKHDIHIANFSAYANWAEAEQALLSKNKRAQIKRSIRAYESTYSGQMICERASSAEQALVYFACLERLHTAYWLSKGSSGSFANKNWVEFTKNIIKHNIENGRAQLYKISVGEHTIGYLYNVYGNGVAYNIQSGFSYEEDNKLKPGFVSHWLVMKDNYEQGIWAYNFLAGSTHYKKSLSNCKEDMVSLVIRKRSDKVKFLLEDTLVRAARMFRGVAH